MTDFSRYFIVTDMDGTLLDRSSQIPERSLDAIRRFVAGGGHFTVATGRPHVLLTPVPSPENILTAPAIAVNGAYLYDFRTGKCLMEQFITPEAAADVLDFLNTEFPHVPWRVAAPAAAVRTATPFGLLLHDMEVYTPKNVAVMPYEAWPLDDWQKVVVREEPDVLDAVRARAEARFGGLLDIFLTGSRLLEMQPVGCSKGAALQKLCGLVGDEDLTVIACGDFENDIEMLRAADIAVAPANAIDSVRAVADMVLCHCDEGLIADVVAHIEAGTLKKRA